MKHVIVKNRTQGYGPVFKDQGYGRITLLETLKNTFGFSSFRPYQEKIVAQICAKRDVVQLR